jgi:hypothetical protein
MITVYEASSPDRPIVSVNSFSDTNYTCYRMRRQVTITLLPTVRLQELRSVCNVCDALYDKTLTPDNARYTATPPCTKFQLMYFDTCNRSFLSDKCYQNHLTLSVKSKLVCDCRAVCINCSFLVTSDSKLECFKDILQYL